MKAPRGGFPPTAGGGIGRATRTWETIRRQPGGWIYNILPYIEQQSLHDMGAGLPQAEKYAAHSRRLCVALPVLYCPTRRRPVTFSSDLVLGLLPGVLPLVRNASPPPPERRPHRLWIQHRGRVDRQPVSAPVATALGQRRSRATLHVRHGGRPGAHHGQRAGQLLARLPAWRMESRTSEA